MVHEVYSFIVMVSKKISNIMRLAELAQAHGKPAYLVDRIDELPHGTFSGHETVLVTAGASAPEETVQECVDQLVQRYGATVETRTVREEHVAFPLPRELRLIGAGS
jgi:4-hydroxy-3-methylbut-2-enyl diphosphate reductase